jgi:transcriptional regulator with XRE-family HTH domain
MAAKIFATETLMARLRELRHVTGTTLEKTAGLVDVHQATLSRWEAGETSPAESRPVRRLVAWYAERAAKGAETAAKVAAT